jgi:ankyrin repeat protein
MSAQASRSSPRANKRSNGNDAAEAVPLCAALHAAVAKGDLDLVDNLLCRGADPNEVHRSGVAALFAAVTPGNAVVCERLLLAEADVQLGLPVCRWTPLHRAAASGATDVARVLLAFGADPDQPKADGQIPLDLARRNAHTAMAEVLQPAEVGSRWQSPPLKPSLYVPTLSQLCVISLRKQLGHNRAALVDRLDLPAHLKRRINHYRPYAPRPPDPPPDPPPPPPTAHLVTSLMSTDPQGVIPTPRLSTPRDSPPHDTDESMTSLKASMAVVISVAVVAAVVSFLVGRLRQR